MGARRPTPSTIPAPHKSLWPLLSSSRLPSRGTTNAAPPVSRSLVPPVCRHELTANGANNEHVPFVFVFSRRPPRRSQRRPPTFPPQHPRDSLRPSPGGPRDLRPRGTASPVGGDHCGGDRAAEPAERAHQGPADPDPSPGVGAQPVT